MEFLLRLDWNLLCSLKNISNPSEVSLFVCVFVLFPLSSPDRGFQIALSVVWGEENLPAVGGYGQFAVGDLFSSEGGLDIKLFYSFDLVMMLKRTFSKY